MKKKLKIEKEIQKMAEKVVQKGLIEIATEIEKKYGNVIEQFYLHYTPLFYRRTQSLFYGSSSHNSYRGKIRKINGGYQVGITVSSQHYPYSANPYGADQDWVFRNAFEKGIHGFDNTMVDEINAKRPSPVVNIPPRMNPSPKGIMDKWWKEYRKKDNLDGIFRRYINKEFKKLGR